MADRSRKEVSALNWCRTLSTEFSTVPSSGHALVKVVNKFSQKFIEPFPNIDVKTINITFVDSFSPVAACELHAGLVVGTEHLVVRRLIERDVDIRTSLRLVLECKVFATIHL